MSDSFSNFENDFENVTGADEDLLAPSSTATSQPFDFEGVDSVGDIKPDVPVEVATSNAELDQLIDFGESAKPAEAADDSLEPSAQSSTPVISQSCTYKYSQIGRLYRTLLVL
jgi:hypothetical protein